MANLQIKNGEIITDTEGIVFNRTLNVASGSYSAAFGNTNTASGTASFAEGQGTTASNTGAHAEGDTTTANAPASHAEGSLTLASGTGAHAEGDATTASGAASHATGSNTTAGGPASFAGGTGTVPNRIESNGLSSFVFGYLDCKGTDIGTAILGGTSNKVGQNVTYNNDYSGIFCGSANNIISTTANDRDSVIVGGSGNTITNCTRSVIIGGNNGTLTAEDDTVLIGGIKRGGYVLSDTLTVAASNSSSSSYNTIWSFNAVAGAIYEMSIIGNYQTALTTTGIKLKLDGTATCNVAGKLYGSISAAAVATELAIVAATMTSQLITTGVSANNTPHSIGANIIFRCTVGGTVLITMASEVNASAAQLNIGSTCIVERIN